jgi:hypothetical protein
MLRFILSASIVLPREEPLYAAGVGRGRQAVELLGDSGGV